MKGNQLKFFGLRIFERKSAEQKLNDAKQDFITVNKEVREYLSHEPASKQVHNAVRSLDEMLEELEK